MTSVITMTTDFGAKEAYVASMKGIILTVNPEATIVDICHSIEPQNILQGAFILSTVYHYFPQGTIHVVIIDPDVGSQRRAIILRTPSAFFVAPDNGVLSYVVDDFCPVSDGIKKSASFKLERRKIDSTLEAVIITNPEFWRQPVSTTFHGRDIFAPVAAYLCSGVPLAEFGEGTDYVYAFPLLRPHYDADDSLIGCVIHIDNFGNLITNIKNNELPHREITVAIGENLIQGISQFYSQEDGLMTLIGSSGYLEIALRDGDAAAFLGTKVGDKVKLSFKADAKIT